MSRLGPIVAGVAALALVALLAYGVVGANENTASIDQAVKDGKTVAAPDRTLPALGEDAQRSIAELRGKVVVLNFWASWCEPCRAEAPMLEQAQKRLAKAGTGTVLGVTLRDASPASMTFAKKFGLTYPSMRDVDGKLAEDYGTHRLPETFVIDRNGQIVAVSRGQLNQKFLDNALAKVRA